MKQYRNWAGNLSCRPKRFVQPRNREELAQVLRNCNSAIDELKVIGSMHSMSDIVCTTGHLISLDRMNQLLRIDKEEATVTVQAGMKLHRLNTLLARSDLGLSVLGSIAEQSIAGAISTGTHSSCRSQGIMATMVMELEIVKYNGERIHITQQNDPTRMNATRVSLGQLGIISEIKLSCVPASLARERLEQFDITEVLDNIDHLLTNDYLRIFWRPAQKRTVVQIINRIAGFANHRASSIQAYYDRIAWAHWIAKTILSNKAVPPFERIGRSDHLFCYPRLAIGILGRLHRLSRGRTAQLNSEYAIPIGAWPDAYKAIREAAVAGEISSRYPLEIRFGAGDENWLSPAYQRDTCYIGFYENQYRSRPKQGIALEEFRAFEELIKTFDARPHWGKIHFYQQEDLRNAFPLWGKFQRLRTELAGG